MHRKTHSSDLPDTWSCILLLSRSMYNDLSDTFVLRYGTVAFDKALSRSSSLSNYCSAQ